MAVTDIFRLEKEPRKGLIWAEWAVIIYMALTTVMAFFLYTGMSNPSGVLMMRVQGLAIIVALCGVYRLLPCRLMMFVRIGVQMAMLGQWYPETYEFNRLLPNWDHLVAAWDQQIFGCQPALLFHEKMPWAWLSEALDMGYASYYFIIVGVTLYYFLACPQEMKREAFVVLGSFFLFYVVFILFPVAGPTFYYKAVGIGTIASGSLPEVGDWFRTHTECLPSPGWTEGFFYQAVEVAKDAGERPTAAFPSSHVGITTVLLWLVWKARAKWLVIIVSVLLALMFFATVYIQAHYAVDALAGLVTGTAFFWMFWWIGGMEKETKKHRK